MDRSNLISIYKVPDEVTGVTLKSLLEEQGIKAILRSSQIPWLDNIMTKALGYWGEILVKEEDRDKAKNIIKDFLKPNNKKSN